MAPITLPRAGTGCKNRRIFSAAACRGPVSPHQRFGAMIPQNKHAGSPMVPSATGDCEHSNRHAVEKHPAPAKTKTGFDPSPTFRLHSAVYRSSLTL